ncbi:MAG: 6-hydroxymethylpterin diphosphokinase MptE-like protein [Candidatus Pacearchaeota archaeon]|jgi:CMP-N-acetylneuraminic acid synthetase
MVRELIQNSYADKRCFIVATGPSLAYKDLSFLKNEVIIALNLGVLTLDLFKIKPTFNIIADKYQYPSFREIYEKLTFNTSIKKIIVASACDTFPKELVDENTYFFPKKLPQEVPDFSENPISEGFSRGKTVAFDALQLAYYLGFKEVYIIGMDMKMDNDWGKNGHCYEIQKNNNFPNIKFYNKNSFEIQRGPPGHPEYIPYINECMEKAKKKFEEKNRRLFNDSRSELAVLNKKDILKEFGNIKKVVAFVPAKGTSSRVENKNMKILGEKPLFLHILDTLLNCYMIDEVYLDTESEEVFNLAKKRNHIELKRDPALANNNTDGNKLLLNEASQVDADIYLQALPTAPFLSRETIDDAIFSLLCSKENDSLFSVIMDKLYLWQENGKPLNYNLLNIPNSIDLKDTIIETMGLYIIKKQSLFELKSRIGKNPILYKIPFIESTDIDTYEDFYLAEAILNYMDKIKNGRN